MNTYGKIADSIIPLNPCFKELLKFAILTYPGSASSWLIGLLDIKIYFSCKRILKVPIKGSVSFISKVRSSHWKILKSSFAERYFSDSYIH